MDQANLNTLLITIILVFAGWAFMIWFRRSADNKKALDKVLERLTALEGQQAEMNFKVTPLWARVQKTLSDDLHHPHAKDKEMDGLLEKLEALEIDEPETEQLKKLLIHRTNDATVPEKERASAAIMATVMDKVLVETEAEGVLTKVELVGEKPEEKGS